jgi:hypothetical protein
MIQQLNPNAPILVNHGVWRWRLQSISLVGGTNQVSRMSGKIIFMRLYIKYIH